jgi:pyruvate dehydrogenase E2 component (dihydrolipoamide acetyltransferase)
VLTRSSNQQIHAAPQAAASPASPSTAKISPKARRLAKELGVDLATIHGSGPGGEVLASDVEKANLQAAATPAPGEKKTGSVEIPTTLGRIMAERTTQSWTTVPHFFVSRDIEATALNQYREARDCRN